MTNFKKILFPTDFSENSEHAALYAKALAARSGGTIDCVYVVDMGYDLNGPTGGVYATAADMQRSSDAILAHAQEELDALVRKEHLLGAEVVAHLRAGHAAEEIVKLSVELETDLIVMSTRGRSALNRLIFGGTCDKVLRLASAPVLTVKAEEHEFVHGEKHSIDIKRVLCPVDFSHFSHAALPLASNLCREFGATAILAHVVDSRMDYPDWTAQVALNNSANVAKSAEKDIAKVAAELTGFPVEQNVSVGIPYRTLVDLANSENIDLIVMPTHGRHGLSHALLGSVAEKMVRYASCPVLTVRPASVSDK